VKVPLTLTLSTILPASAIDAKVIAALQAEAASAAYEALAIMSAGARPSNVTVVPTVTTNADGSATVTLRVIATYAATVNTTVTVAAASYAADPSGVITAAGKAASNSAGVVDATAGLMYAALRAAAGAAAFANGTILTGTPPSTLASRFAAVTSAALIVAGKSNLAALVNATSMTLTVVTSAVGSATVDLSAAAGGAPALGVAASGSSDSFPESLNNGIFSGVAFAFATVAALYFFVKWRRLAAAPAKEAAKRLSAGSGDVVNPMFKHKAQRPTPPSSKPPKHAYQPYQSFTH
jgi:hypothetical protein